MENNVIKQEQEDFEVTTKSESIIKNEVEIEEHVLDIINNDIKKEIQDDSPEFLNISDFSDNIHEKIKTEPLKDVMRCTQCPSKYQKLEYLEIHQIFHGPERFCTLCSENFSCKKKFQIHLNKHIKDKMKQDKELDCLCPYCKTQFPTRKRFKAHLRTHTNERPYKCDICNERFKQLGALKEHNVTHTKDKQYVCEVCHGAYTTNSSLRRHMKKIHNQNKTIKCGHCDARFLNKSDFQEHRKNVHFNILFKKECPCCNLKFFSKYSYEKHRESHPDKAGITYNCLLCGEHLGNLRLYATHKRMHMQYTKEEYDAAWKENIFKCKFCDRELATQQSLFRHIAVHMERTVKCEVCKESFSKFGLKTHIIRLHKAFPCRVCSRTIHGKRKLYRHYEKFHPKFKKKFACGICGKKYMTKVSLLGHHNIVHEKKIVYRCQHCRRIFYSNEALSDHEKIHHRKVEYKCMYCNVMFKNRPKFLMHIVSHNTVNIEQENEDQKTYTCILCKKLFSTLNRYKLHIQTCRAHMKTSLKHTKSSKWKCKVCSRVLSGPGSYDRHMSVHIGKVYTCKYCERKYRSYGGVQKHVVKLHPEKNPYWCSRCGKEFGSALDKTEHLMQHCNKNAKEK